jgi:hypothetical protein
VVVWLSWLLLGDVEECTVAVHDVVPGVGDRLIRDHRGPVTIDLAVLARTEDDVGGAVAADLQRVPPGIACRQLPDIGTLELTGEARKGDPSSSPGCSISTAFIPPA